MVIALPLFLAGPCWHGQSMRAMSTPPAKLYETTLVRHGIMLVGPTGGGKTKIFRCLRMALDKTTGIIHKDSRFNPKAIRAQEMYGEVDPATGEWNTGDELARLIEEHSLGPMISCYGYCQYVERGEGHAHYPLQQGPL